MMKQSLSVLFLLASSWVWGAQPSGAQVSSLAGLLAPKQDLHLGPGAERSYSLAVPPGQVVSVTFEQTVGMVQVRWLPEGLSPEARNQMDQRVNRSGRHAAILFRSIGWTHSEGQPTTGTFVVQNQSKRAAEVRILTGAARQASVDDGKIAQAEADTAHAVALSANRTPANLTTSLELLQSAEQQWRYFKDSADAHVELTRVLALEAYLQAFPMDDGAAAVANLPALIENAAKIENASTVEAANAYKTAGFVYAKQARYDDALAQYNAALLLFNKTDDSYNRVVVLENRAKVERIQGHNRTALADVEAAIPLAQQNQDSRGELALEVERGAIAYASGQLGLAYEANLRAIALAAASHDDFLEGIAWSDQGMVATELHNFDEAAHDFDHADAIWNHAPNAYGQIQTREDQAEMRLAKGDLQGAQAIFAEGVDEAAKSSLDREQVFFLRGLAVSEMRSTKLTEAEQHLDQAIEKAERIQVADELSAIYASKGDLDAAQSHWSDAKAHWQRADALALQRGDTLDHVIALGGLVRAALELGDSRAASEHCQAAMSALESIRAGISDADLRLSFFASRHALYDLCVQTEIRSGDPQAAFDAAERGRARSLLDQAAASGVQAELPSSLLDAINDNSDQLRQLRERISKKAHNTSQAKLGDENAALLRARDQLRIQAQQSGLSDALAAASLPLNEREVRAELDPQTAVLAYWLGDKSSRVWCITSRGVSSSPLASAAVLRAKTKRYMTALLAPASSQAGNSAAERRHALEDAHASAQAQGVALRRTLLPMAIPPQIRRLILVKDGAILGLSFASLPYSQGSYLGEHFQIASEPSVTMAFRATRKHAPGAKMLAVVFADPSAFDASQAQPPSGRNERPGLEQVSLVASLPFARQEAHLIAEVLGERNTTVFSGASASRAQALRLDWSAFNIAHFATHAIYRDNHLELSGLLLSSDPASPKSAHAPLSSSILSFSDVLRMRAHLQLAVLSACNSDVGKFIPGEGMLALDNAFLAAGTSTVIGTLWPVDDEASSVFMAHFYHALAGNRSPIQSLKEAQRAMAASTEWSAPYYWGAFSLSGDWHPFPN